MSEIKVVCADFDDTFVPSEEACFALENEVLTRMGRLAMPREVHLSTWGQPVFDAMLKRSPGVDIEAFKKQYDVVIAEFTAAGRLDVVPEENYVAMDEIVASGREFSILTSRTVAELKHILDPTHRLGSEVVSFWHKDNTSVHKPDPAVFDEFFRHHAGVRPDECVYVGDSISDAIATKKRGMWFIASLESGLRSRQDFEALEATEGLKVDAYIARFADLPTAVDELEARITA